MSQPVIDRNVFNELKDTAGAEFLVHAEMLVLGEQLRNVAGRIVDVAEGERLGDARVDAGRRRLRVDSRRLPVREAGVDALDAEGALGGHSASSSSSAAYSVVSNNAKNSV